MPPLSEKRLGISWITARSLLAAVEKFSFRKSPPLIRILLVYVLVDNWYQSIIGSLRYNKVARCREVVQHPCMQVWSMANASLGNIHLFLRFLCHPYILTDFVENFYSSLVISIKRSAKWLFANSSRERRRIETKLSQPSDAVSDLDLRGSACANKLPPRSVWQKKLNRPPAILDLRRKYTVFRAWSYACNAKEKPQRLFASVDESRPNFPSRRTLYHISI